MSDWLYGRYGVTYYTPYRKSLAGIDFYERQEAMKAEYAKLLKPYTYIDLNKLIPNTQFQHQKTDDLGTLLALSYTSPEYYAMNLQDDIVYAGAKLLGKYEYDVPGKREKDFFTHALLITQEISGGVIVGADALVNFGLDFADLGYAHYGELCMSWLDSLEGEFSYADPRYRILYVNCPVDIKVYDSNATLVASIDNDVVAEIENGIVAYIDFDGQKVIALPNDEEYTIKMTATDSGNVTYTATQYNMDSGITEKVVSYYEVDVVDGDLLTGIAENLETISGANYPLYLNGSNDSLTPDISQSGDAIPKYSVSVSKSGNGAAVGGGNYVSGEFSKVTATASDNETFLGWYVNNNLISSDAEYRFLVTENTNITARFTQNISTPDNPTLPDRPVNPNYSGGSGSGSNPTYNVTIPVSLTGGTVKVTPASAKKGTTVTLTAIPDEGYELTTLTVTDGKGKELELTDKGGGKYTFVMPASAVTVNAVFKKVEPAESTPIDETHLFPFTDVLRTDWFSNAVEYVFTNDLMSGTAPYTFDPQGKMNRAMVWTVLGRMADADVDGSESPWYSKAQAWAMSNNISDGTNPTNSISRQELMTMLWRYIGSPAATADLNKFSDSESVADWAGDAMQWAVSTGLIVGDNGRLNPTGDARRCEVAMIFMRYCENSVE